MYNFNVVCTILVLKRLSQLNNTFRCAKLQLENVLMKTLLTLQILKLQNNILENF